MTRTHPIVLSWRFVFSQGVPHSAQFQDSGSSFFISRGYRTGVRHTSKRRDQAGNKRGAIECGPVPGICARAGARVFSGAEDKLKVFVSYAAFRLLPVSFSRFEA